MNGAAVPRTASPAFLLPALLFLAACSHGGPLSPAGPAADPAPVEVRVAPATLVLEVMVEVPASIEARHEAALASRMLAAIESVSAEVGDVVRAGQVLVTLDARDVLARAAAAEAALRAAQSHHDRVQALLAKEAATVQEMEAALADRDAAAAALEAARAEGAYVRLAAPFHGRVTERHVSAGDLARPGEPLLVIQREIEDRAPAGHMVDATREGAAKSRPPEKVESGAGGEPGVGLDEGAAPRRHDAPGRRGAARGAETSSGSLRAAATVAADQIARVAPGMPVEVVLEDGTAVPARVTIVSAAGDPASRRFLVKADLPAGTSARSGSFARLRLPSPADPPLVAAPATALFERGSLTGLFVVEEGRARLRWISPGEETPGGRIIVRSGLREGEQVVLDPSRVKDGAPVIAMPGPAAANGSAAGGAPRALQGPGAASSRAVS